MPQSKKYLKTTQKKQNNALISNSMNIIQIKYPTIINISPQSKSKKQNNQIPQKIPQKPRTQQNNTKIDPLSPPPAQSQISTSKQKKKKIVQQMIFSKYYNININNKYTNLKKSIQTNNIIMIQQRPNSIQQLNSPTIKNDDQLKKQPKLIQFDTISQQIQQFKSDYNSQIDYKQNSVISTETQKQKKQRRNKVKQYLNTVNDGRKSVGGNMYRKTVFEGADDDINGDIVDQLDNISDLQKIHGETEQFILAFNKNPQNAINQCINKGIIHSDQPDVIAAYLIKFEGLDKHTLGQYFGLNNQKVLKVLHSFCKLLNFKNIQFDQALRLLLSRFILPGQAQQIQRIVWEFSLAFYQTNQQLYQNADQLFPLTYATIMLNTDAHNQKQQKKMSKDDFIKNTKRVCPSITSQYLSNIYDRITAHQIQTQLNNIENVYAWLKDINVNDFRNTLKLTTQLKKGDIFLKVCKNTPKFVQRKLYLSDDQLRINWVCNPSTNQMQQPRFIEIKDITDLILGLHSDVMKKTKVPQQFDPMCFTIQTTHRTLDLKAKSNKQRAKWLNYIKAVLIRRRQTRIQYLQNQQKKGLQRQQIQQIWNADIFQNWDRHWDYKKKKPLVRNVIARGIQAICCCFSRKPTTSDVFQHQGQFRGLKIKTSKLQTLWRLGLPANSRKVLWPLVIGNNLALNSAMIQQIKKRKKPDQNLRKYISFNPQTIEMAQICRQFRPDIPPIRDLLLISSIFLKAIPKNPVSNQSTSTKYNCLTAFLNLLHLDHFLSFYRGVKNQIDLRIQLFQFLLQKNSYKIKKHFQVLKLQTRMYLVSWFLSIYTHCFSNDNEQQFIFRIWDNFLLEGQNYLFKIGITIIKYFQIQLKMCTFHQALKILKFPKNISILLFFQILENQIDVKQQYFINYIQMRKQAIIKTKVQAIPLQ